jgi:hypothetical protein
VSRESAKKIILEPAQEQANLHLVNTEDSQLSRFYYQISNHDEIFKIGNSFLEDYKKNQKNFAISSTGYKASQQRTILGISCFFDHRMDIKIGIVSDSLDTGVFAPVVKASELEIISDLKSVNRPVSVYRFYHHFDFIDMNTFLKLGEKVESSYTYEKAVKEILGRYDLIFWDVPELESIKRNTQIYFPLISFFDSLTIVVSQERSMAREVAELKDFFQNYGMNFKGVLMDENKKKEDEKKKWYQKWF